MWIPLTMAAVGALLFVSGLFWSMTGENAGVLDNKPLSRKERVALWAMATGFGLIIVANAITYFSPEGVPQ